MSSLKKKLKKVAERYNNLENYVPEPIVKVHEFWINDFQDKKLKKFQKKHKKCGLDLKSRTQYIFSPTGIGDVVTYVCYCGEEIDLTDYDNW